MNIGNAWHIPRNAQPRGQASMRFPLEEIDARDEVVLTNGNQFRGSGNAGNQTRSGSFVMIRAAGDSTWTAVPMRFQTAAGNDKFFLSTVAANRFPAGTLVQYYFKIDYTDRDTTFLHGDDARSIATADEAAAQANPFTFGIRFPLAAEGPSVPVNSGPLQARIYRNSGHVEIAGPNLAGAALANAVTLAPAAVEVENRVFNIGRVITTTSVPGGVEVTQELGTRQIRARLTFPISGVMRYEVMDWGGKAPTRIVFDSESDADEHFYGFGEKFNQLDQAGKLVDIRVFDEPGDKGDRSYKVAPWFVSTRGYGLHLDSPARSRFDMRTAANGRYRVSTQSSSLRINLVYGPRLMDVLMRYTEMTGRPPLPPPWVFGHWISSDVWQSGGEVRYAVSRFSRRGIPSSIFVFDSPWEIAYNDFRFNRDQFAAGGRFENESFDGFDTPLAMMRFLQENGLKVVCWMTPFVNIRSNDEDIPGQNLGQASNYAEAAQSNLFVRASAGGPPLLVNWWKGRGSPVDFTNPEARTWLQDQLRKLLKDTEVDTASGKESAVGGFKTDDGEFSNGPDVYIPPTAVYANGLTGREFVNGYCVEYHRTVYDVLGQAGYLFARSGFTGTQAFPAYWAGDNQPNFGDENGLRSVIVAGLSAAMSGFSIWAHDIGGYQNANFSPVSKADMFIRWTQFGCFSPIMQIHRQVSQMELQYPWGYREGVEDRDDNRATVNYAFYAKLHTRLFPYIYTYARVSQDTGLPIVRPLVLMHQDDERTFPVRHTYYFGAELLIAPVIEPLANRRRVYLPEGEWIDFWTHQRHTGKQDIEWQSPAQPAEPASKIPVFVRSGAIVPFILGDDVQSLCDANYINNPQIKTWDGGLDIHVYPDGDTRFAMFDGTLIVSSRTAGSTTVTVRSPSPRSVLLRILGSRPAGVLRDGTALSEASSAAAFEAAAAAWRFDSGAGFVLVKFPQPAGTVVITL